MDRATQLLIDALRQAASQAEPCPLYKTARQPGLFPSRSGAAGEAAAKALNDQLLEIVPSDSGSKAKVEYVRVTPRGVQFLCEHDSPREVLRELVLALQQTRSGLPRWAEEVQAQMRAVSHRLQQFLDRQTVALELLEKRVDAALRRIGSPPSDELLTPWQLDALIYLDQRRAVAGDSECPFQELFSFLRQNHAALSLPEFHRGIRRLVDRGALALSRFSGSVDQLKEPEYALLDGATVYHAVRRA